MAVLFPLCSLPPRSSAQVIEPEVRNRSRELIIKLKPQGSAAERDRALRNATSTKALAPGLRRSGLQAQNATSTLLVRLRDGVAVGSELARLASNPAVEYAEPNYPLHLLDRPPVLPNDFEFSKMYALQNLGGSDTKTNADIHAPEAWAYSTGDKRVIVAVIDTGIDYLHEDLRDNVWTNDKEIPFNGIDDDGNGLVDDYMGYDFVSNDSDPFDDNEHGTHVSGIIGAKGNDGIGTVGVCWQVSLMALKAFDEQGNGTVDAAISAIEYAVKNGARIINASWGLDERSRALEDAVQAATDAGVLFVAAAGNNRSDAPSYPASFDSVLSVGATDAKDQRAIFSNYGPTVDIAAPGDNIFSTLPENSYGYLSGTSMAAPHVSGVAALVLSLYPNYSREELFNILINSVDPVTFDQLMGNGRLNAALAVQMTQPLPTARVDVPATVSGTLDITGSASGSFASGYGVFIGSGKSPTNWLPVAGSSVLVTNGLLAHLDTALVPDGPAVVQLVVTNQNDQTATVNAPVKVLNALISYPVSGDVLAPGKFELRGTLYGPDKRFELSFGAGLNPTNWTNLASVGNKTILVGKLGEWDASNLPTGPYCLRMVSWTGTNRAEFLAPMIYIDQHMREGWPVNVATDKDFPVAEWRNVRVADLDGDGQAEFVIADPGTPQRPQRLLVYSLAGQLLWSKDLGFDIPPDVPAIGDVDGDGKLEIFIDLPDGIAAFHFDGSPVSGWPIKTSMRNQAKVLADLNRDGKLELITYSQEYSATQVPDLRELAVYSGKGSLVRKWSLPWCGATNDVQKIFPAVANLDDDPVLEIIAVSGCSQISAYDYRQDQPKWTATGDGVFLTSPVIGDVDGDGSLDIVVAAAAANDASNGGVYIFHANGERWRGFPVLEEYSFTAAPALGDLDHDGKLEIALVSTDPSALHLLQWDGFEADGWPLNAFENGSSRVGVSLADIDGDGTSEIITGMPGLTTLALVIDDTKLIGGINARTLSGQIIPFNGTNAIESLPFDGFTPYRTFKASPPLLGDFDGDGLLDLAISSLQERSYGTDPKLKNRSGFYNWKLGAAVRPRTLEWPMFAHDLQNQGAYTLPPLIVPQSTNFTRAIRDRVLGEEDRPVQFTPLANDQGAPPLQLLSFSQPQNGTVTRDSETTLSYQPKTNYAGMDEFTYTMRDATGTSATGRVIVRVKPVNDPPVAQDISLTMKKNSFVNVFYTATDPENDKISYRVIDAPSHGELWNYPALGEYYPKRGFFGTDSFHYVANDGKRDSDPALVSIEVINSNNPPTVVSQDLLTKTNRSVHIDPQGSDLDGDDVTFDLVKPPKNGAATAEGNGFLYTPKQDFVGEDSFTVRPFDGTAYGDPGTMTIGVIATNAAPIAPNGFATAAPNSPLILTLPGRDPDGDKVTYTIVTPPSHGTLDGTPPKMIYTPETNYVGPDKFTYKLTDGFAETAPATFTVSIVRRNRPPQGQNQTVSTTVSVPVQIGLELTDPDGDPLRSVILRGPSSGLLYGSGTNYTFVPKAGTQGSDSFTYKGWDGQKFGNLTRVTLQISLPRDQQPPSFRTIEWSADAVLLQLDVPNTNAFYLEASSNIVDWITVGGPFVSPEGFSYRDSNDLGARRFYRARRQN